MGNSRYRFKMNVEGLEYELVFPANNYVRQVIVSVFMFYSFGTVVKNFNSVFSQLSEGGGCSTKKNHSLAAAPKLKKKKKKKQSLHQNWLIVLFFLFYW